MMPRVTRHTAHPPRLQLHCHHLFLSKRRFHPPSKRAYLNTGTRQLTLDFTLTKQVFSLSNELPNHVDHRANHTAPPTSPFILGVEHDYPFVPTLSTFLGDPSAPLPPPPRSVVFNSTPNPSPHSTSSATPVVHPLIAGDMEQEGRIVSAPLGVPRTILSAGLDLASYRITESDILSEAPSHKNLLEHMVDLKRHSIPSNITTSSSSRPPPSCPSTYSSSNSNSIFFSLPDSSSYFNPCQS